MSDLRLVGGTVVCLDAARRILLNGEVGCSAGRIDYVGPARPEAAGSIVDCRGKALLPGLVNAHTHAAMTLLRSYADDMPLQPWLETRIWPVEAHLRPEDVYWGTQLAALEMVRAGVTCFHDMYWHAPEASRAGLEAGLRVAPSGVLIGLLPTSDAMLSEAIDFVDACLAAPHPRRHVRFGPHAPYTVPDAYLEKVIAAAAERHVPVHIHLAETAKEIHDSIAAHGEPTVRHMHRVGLFEVTTCAAHCVHLEPDELELLAAKQVGVLASHTSNLKLGCGIIALPDLLAAGAVVGLGTDGTASNNNLDILEEARLAALLHKGVRRDATLVTAWEALELATWRGAQAIGLPDLGRLTVGYRADLIAVDLSAPHLCPGTNVVSDLVYAAQASDVTDMYVGGAPVMRDRQILTLDQPAVLAKAREAAQRLIRLAAS
ncbi:MAG: amidohydrolase [Fimbriimonadaceae bacterium]|nr:amidohydrolase [Fimbriimonadaceae bacterium]